LRYKDFFTKKSLKGKDFIVQKETSLLNSFRVLTAGLDNLQSKYQIFNLVFYRFFEIQRLFYKKVFERNDFIVQKETKVNKLVKITITMKYMKRNLEDKLIKYLCTNS
jgi:hypothetical protein